MMMGIWGIVTTMETITKQQLKDIKLIGTFVEVYCAGQHTLQVGGQILQLQGVGGLSQMFKAGGTVWQKPDNFCPDQRSPASADSFCLLPKPVSRAVPAAGNPPGYLCCETRKNRDPEQRFCRAAPA